MLKEEPRLLYMYEYIKPIDVKEDVLKSFELDHINKGFLIKAWEVGDMVYTEKDSMNEEYFKFIGTFRRAFVGDMQEQLDKVMKGSNMLAFCNSKKNLNSQTVFVTKYVY
jgi:hypothetical protein